MNDELDKTEDASEFVENLEPTFTDILILAREESGYTISRAATATRITPQFIEALEKGEYDKLPGVVFGRGFIRALCKIYNKNPASYLQAFENALNQNHMDISERVKKEEISTGSINRKSLKNGHFLGKLRKYSPTHYFHTPRSVIYFSAASLIVACIYFFAVKRSEITTKVEQPILSVKELPVHAEVDKEPVSLTK